MRLHWGTAHFTVAKLWRSLQLCAVFEGRSCADARDTGATIRFPIMPTYEYVCEKCGAQFEKVQSMKDKPLTICPKEVCGQKRWGKGKVRKLMSAGAGLIFKGSGFYITDYRSENYKQAAKKETGSSGSENKTGTAAAGDGKAAPPKAETKPAKKAKD